MAMNILSEYAQEVLGLNLVFGGDIFMYWYKKIEGENPYILVSTIYISAEHRKEGTYTKVLKNISDRHGAEDIVIMCNKHDGNVIKSGIESGFWADAIIDDNCYLRKKAQLSEGV